MGYKNNIPLGWRLYNAMGRRIPGSRFIAFKVPLKRNMLKQIDQSERFGPSDLKEIMEKEGLELGLVIDLTFTDRYYKPQELPESCQYLKLYTVGHDVPTDKIILSFKRAVRRFLRENQDNDKLIGVHCTHGLNRTGYLICRYLIDVDGFEPAEAIDMFNASRGHRIERENYLDDLKSGPNRSNEGMEEPDQEPIQCGEQPESSPEPQRPRHPYTRHPYTRHPYTRHPYTHHPYTRPPYERPHFSWRGPRPHGPVMPFQPGAVNHHLMFPPPGPTRPPKNLGPPGPHGPPEPPALLGPPGLLPFPQESLPVPQGPEPHRPVDHSVQHGHHTAVRPYPAFLPKYSWGGGAPVCPPAEPAEPEEPQQLHGKFRPGKLHHGQAR